MGFPTRLQHACLRFAGFRAAWRACPSSTAVVHMDVDAPALMAGLYEQVLRPAAALSCLRCMHLVGAVWHSIKCLQRVACLHHLRCLMLQDVSGLWEKKTVQCRSGAFMPGDYSSWKRWRDALADVERL